MNTYKTASNEIIAKFAQSIVHCEYVYANPRTVGKKFVRIPGEIMVGEVWKGRKNDHPNFKLLVTFTGRGYDEKLYVDVTTGEAYFWDAYAEENANGDYLAENLGILDSDDFKALVPAYNKYWYDEKAELCKFWAENGTTPDNLEGFHDEFSLLFRGLKHVPGGVVAVNEKHLPKNYVFKNGQWVLK